MTHEEAKATFRQLVAQHGLRWTSKDIPQIHWDLLAECNNLLDEDGRREAIGLPSARRK